MFPKTSIDTNKLVCYFPRCPKGRRAVAQGFSVQVWGTWSRWFKSSLPETQRVRFKPDPLVFIGIDTGFETESQEDSPSAKI